MRKIAVVTGTRAEYGLLYWIIKGIHEDPELELQLLVTGMHLSHEFGYTAEVIEKDGFPIAEKVEMLLSSDTETAIAASMGLGMIGFAKIYERLSPDLLLVLGDRFEILSAVAAAAPFRIPVAHIHGGETTEGAMDELFRHAITKMSHIHFPATEEYADRIKRMGENPDNIYCFGAPGLDNIQKLKLMNKEHLAEELNLPPDRQWGLVTYHPVTLEKGSAAAQVGEILDSLDKFPHLFWIFTMPNADTEGRIIMKKIETFASKYPDNAALFNSLGQLRYLSLLKYSSLMVGNSSSGLIEAPSFKLPVVNVGNRQRGRLRAENVVDIPCNKERITDAIKKVLSDDFQDLLKDLRNPYGDGNASEKIINVIKKADLKSILHKHFHS